MAFLGLGDSGLDPIVQDHAPSGQDYAQSGQIWVDETGGDVFIACGTSGGLQVWVGCGGGTGAFNAVTVNPGNLTVTAGNLAVTAGTVTFGTFGRGLVFSSASGLLSSAAGTDGQIVVGATGASPLWASLASSDGSVGIAVGANTIDLTVTGATGSSFPTDAGIATPVAGATTITGGTNIGTSGAGGVVTINLDASPSVAGTLTAATGISSTVGNITAVAGNLVASLGGVIAQTSVTATTGAITANTGNISATLGSVSAGTTVNAGTTITAGTGITSTTGNITSTAGNLVTSTAGKGVVLGGGAKIVCGAGDPNGVVTAPVGSLYLNTTGSGVADRIFVNSDAATTWVAVTTVS